MTTVAEHRYQFLESCRHECVLTGSRFERMEQAVKILWQGLHDYGVSWLGFYLHEGKDELVLGARENKPACSPIGLHGVCGKALLEKKVQIVPDVHALGPSHIVCDPRNLSELVIPLFDKGDVCWGVFDLDSFEKNSFTARDAEILTKLFMDWGLTIR